MKKLLLILMLGMFSVAAEAQIPLFALKIMGGINAPSLKIPDAATDANNMGYAFSLDAAFGKKHYFQFGLSARNYSAKMTKDHQQGVLSFSSYGIHAYYGFQIIDLKILKLRGFLGPNYELYNKIETKDLPLDAALINTNGFRFAAGLEAKLAMFLFSLQYEPSFTDLSTTGASKSGVFVAKVGISLL